MYNFIKNNSLARFFNLVFYLLLISALAACSGGSSSPKNESADGLFKNGTANLNGGSVMLNDLRALSYGNRIIIFSLSGNLLFDGQITNITVDDYTATFDVYDAGAIAQSGVSVTGKVTTASQITGTLNGTGVASGTFTLVFDSTYNTGASNSRIIPPINSDWGTNLLTTFSLASDTNFQDNLGMIDTGGALSVNGPIANDAATTGCSLEGPMAIPDSNLDLYTVENDFPSSLSPNSTICPFVDPAVKFTGFAAVLSESAPDNDLLYAVTNGDYAIFGKLSITP